MYDNILKINNETYTGKEEPEQTQNNNNKSDDDFNYKPEDLIPEGWIDNLLNEEDKKIGFDLKLLKRDELNVNLIHFDKNMTNKENYEYYNKFKVNVVGGFQAVDDINFLKGYLEVIKDKNIHLL